MKAMKNCKNEHSSRAPWALLFAHKCLHLFPNWGGGGVELCSTKKRNTLMYYRFCVQEGSQDMRLDVGNHGKKSHYEREDEKSSAQLHSRGSASHWQILHKLRSVQLLKPS
jgi:hypothetical protein